MSTKGENPLPRLDWRIESSSLTVRCCVVFWYAAVARTFVFSASSKKSCPSWTTVPEPATIVLKARSVRKGSKQREGQEKRQTHRQKSRSLCGP